MLVGSDWNKHCAAATNEPLCKATLLDTVVYKNTVHMGNGRMVFTATKCHTHANHKPQISVGQGLGVLREGKKKQAYPFQTPGAVSANEVCCLSRLWSR